MKILSDLITTVSDEILDQNAQLSLPDKVILLLLSIAIFAAVSLLLVQGVKNCQIPVYNLESEFEGYHYIASIRLLGGQAIYPPHEIYGEYLPYPPLTAILFATGMFFFGPSVVVTKWITFSALILSLIGILLITYNITKSFVCAFISIGLFSIFHKLTLFWYFKIRPDIFCTALSLWATLFALKARSKNKKYLFYSTIATSLYTLSAYSKHNFLLFPVVYILFLLYDSGIKTSFVNLLVFFFINVTMLFFFNTGDNDMISVLFSMQSHDLRPIASASLKLLYAFKDFPVSILFCIIALLPIRKEEKFSIAFPMELLLFFTTSFLVGIIAYYKIGGGINSLMAFTSAMSILASAGIQKTTRFYNPNNNKVLPCLLIAPIIVIIFNLPDNYFNFVRMDINALRLQRLEEYVKKLPGKVYVPAHNYIAYKAGKGYHADAALVLDRNLAGEGTPAVIADKINQQYFDQIIGLNSFLFSYELSLKNIILKNYKVLIPSPLKGWSVWVPKKK
jgi:hypothetical protein